MFTINNTLLEISEEPALKKYLPYFVYHHDLLAKSGHKPIRTLWNEAAAQAVLNALERICENEKKQNCLYRIYPEADTENAHVRVVDFPCENGGDKPWVLLCAGGSYLNVWNLTEAWTTALYFNKLGYHVFTLNYTVGYPGLMPKPLADTAAAVSWIRRNAAQLGIRPQEYVIGGFSAGGHLAGAWATEARGWAKYGLPSPCAALLIYPATSSDYVEPEVRAIYRANIAGAEASPETVAGWNVENIATASYPPTYLIHSEDDPLVGVETSRVLENRLKALGVPVTAEYVKHSGHGFCDGAGTDAADWPLRADRFLRQHTRG